MLTLNQEVYAIVDETGQVEYDYDGPMLECIEGSDGKYIRDCLKYITETSTKPVRIARVKLVEIP